MAFKFIVGFSLILYSVGIIFAYLFYKKPPLNINSKYGYRTTLSMKNNQNWSYANMIAPPIMIKTLVIGLILLLLVLLLFKNSVSFDSAPIFVIIYLVFNSVSVLAIVEYKLNIYDKANCK